MSGLEPAEPQPQSIASVPSPLVRERRHSAIISIVAWCGRRFLHVYQRND
jgi:hypothetical protein